MNRAKIVLYATTACILGLLMACATPQTYLTVGFRVPVATGELAGQNVRLAVTDDRTRPDVLSPAAAGKLAGFRDRYQLIWMAGDEDRRPGGYHNLANLFRAAFERRLLQLGVAAVPGSKPEVPVLAVSIREFWVDLADRRWVAGIGYEAALSLADGTRVSETITGSAERMRIVGREGLDELLADIFSTLINRADIRRLFEKAGRI